jgi:hypothetical protein
MSWRRNKKPLLSPRWVSFITARGCCCIGAPVEG